MAPEVAKSTPNLVRVAWRVARGVAKMKILTRWRTAGTTRTLARIAWRVPGGFVKMKILTRWWIARTTGSSPGRLGVSPGGSPR